MRSRIVGIGSTLLLAILALLVVLPVAAVEPAAPQDAAARAVAWIKTQQQPDGSFAGFGIGSTADALLALAAAGENPAAIAAGGSTPLAFLQSQSAEIAQDPGVAAKVAIALLVAGRDPHTSIGVDTIEAVKSGYDESTGHYGADATSHALALLALRAAEGQAPEAAIGWLAAAQLEDGSWSFSGERAPGGGDTNTTALAVQALVAHGQKDTDTVKQALAYLHTQQNVDGGFPYSQTSPYGNASDANSTAYVIQAIIAVGQEPSSWGKDGAMPVDRLLAFQNDSGAFRYQDSAPDDNQLATYQAVPALLGVTFPLEPLAIIQQPEAQPQPTEALPLPETGVAEQPASLPDTSGEQPGSAWLLLLAMLAALLGLLLRSARPLFRR